MDDCFHVTFARNLPSIRKNGLLTRQRRIWKNNFGSQLGDLGYLYVTTTRISAIRWAAHMEWHHEKSIVILRLRSPDSLEPDPNVMASSDAPRYWKRTRKNISYSDILEEIPVTSDLVREAVRSLRSPKGQE